MLRLNNSIYNLFICFHLFFSTPTPISLVFSSRLASRAICSIYRGMHHNINCKVYRRFASVDTYTYNNAIRDDLA